MPNKKFDTVLRSLPLIETLELPSRAELLPKIESGEIEHLDFRARVFRLGPNRNFYRFRAEDMLVFASSFEGQPFLRNHDSYDIDARDGTIVASLLQGEEIVQDIRLTTRRGMIDFLEGKIDRFSIGWWDYSDVLCSVCGLSYLSMQCVHFVGRTYDTPSGQARCEITFIAPKGKETSAVNAPAVPGTGIDMALDAMLGAKLDILGPALVRLAANEADLTAEHSQPDGQAPVEQGYGLDEGEAQARHHARAERLALAEQFEPSQKGVVPMNIRELQKQRAGLIEQANALQKAAENEARDLSEEERDQFSAALDEADKILGRIKVIQDERARLDAALQSLGQISSDAEQPVAGQAGAKTMKRDEFEALSPDDRMQTVRAGVKIEE